MTAYNTISRGQRRPHNNKKDGGRQMTSKNLSQFREETWSDLGFVEKESGAHSYTWGPGFPEFSIKPEITQGRVALVARFKGIETSFRVGERPSSLKTALDEEILRIMRNDAGIDDEPIDWDELKSEGIIIEF